MVDLGALGEQQITVDCDVIQADGGTRTASITGGWVALYDCLRWMEARQMVSAAEGAAATMWRRSPAASTTGRPVLDLDYVEDPAAGTDANFVMTGKGGIVEIQGTAEGVPFSEEEFATLMALAKKGISRLVEPAADGGGVRRPCSPRPSSNRALYVTDLDAAEAFYRDVLGLVLIGRVDGRACLLPLRQRRAVALQRARRPEYRAAARCKTAGAAAWHGRPGHLCFAATADEIDAVEDARSTRRGIAIEADFEWPQGGRSIYLRDPSGNSIEFAEPRIWGFVMRNWSPMNEDRRRQPQCRQAARVRRPDGAVRLEAKSARNTACPSPTRPARPSRRTPTSRRIAAAQGDRPAGAVGRFRPVHRRAWAAQPGVYTANWAETPDGGARFRPRHAARRGGACRRSARSSLASAAASSPSSASPGRTARPNIFAARRKATLVWPPRGDKGFGYDPVFVPNGHERTFGEMSAEEKHGWKPGQADALSHRARAFQKFAPREAGLGVSR